MRTGFLVSHDHVFLWPFPCFVQSLRCGNDIFFESQHLQRAAFHIVLSFASDCSFGTVGTTGTKQAPTRGGIDMETKSVPNQTRARGDPQQRQQRRTTRSENHRDPQIEVNKAENNKYGHHSCAFPSQKAHSVHPHYD